MSRSEGSRLLGVVTDSQAQIARRVGVSRVTVGYWVSGERVPRDLHRERLESLYGIPFASWPDKYTELCNVVVEKLSVRAPDLLAEIINDLSSDID